MIGLFSPNMQLLFVAKTLTIPKMVMYVSFFSLTYIIKPSINIGIHLRICKIHWMDCMPLIHHNQKG